MKTILLQDLINEMPPRIRGAAEEHNIFDYVDLVRSAKEALDSCKAFMTNEDIKVCNSYVKRLDRLSDSVIKIDDEEYQYKGRTIRRNDEVPAGCYNRWCVTGKDGRGTDSMRKCKILIDILSTNSNTISL